MMLQARRLIPQTVCGRPCARIIPRNPGNLLWSRALLCDANTTRLTDSPGATPRSAPGLRAGLRADLCPGRADLMPRSRRLMPRSRRPNAPVAPTYGPGRADLLPRSRRLMPRVAPTYAPTYAPGAPTYAPTYAPGRSDLCPGRTDVRADLCPGRAEFSRRLLQFRPRLAPFLGSASAPSGQFNPSAPAATLGLQSARD